METRVIACTNQKGGVGKTTTCINLAACLAESERRVLVVDLDPQANATSGLGLEKTPGQSLYAVLLGEARAADYIRPSAVAGLDVLPSEIDLAGAEIEVARADRYLHRVREALAPIVAGNHYDYICIDCPPSLGILTMNALAAADGMLVPLQCEYYALEGLSVISRLLTQLRDGGANPGLELEGIVMTMYDGRTNIARQVVQEVQNHFPERVYRTLIPRNVRLSEAPSHGLPIIAYDPASAGASAYRALTREFLERRAADSQPIAATPA